MRKPILSAFVTLSLGLAVLFPPAVPAAPDVTSAAGTFVHKSRVTITGSGFGVKSNPAQAVPAAPLIWDITSEQYVGGTNRDAYAGLLDGQPVNARIWQKVQHLAGETARYSTSRSHRHPRMLAHYAANGIKLTLGKPWYPNGSGLPPPTQKSFYLSFYRKLKNPANSLGGGDGSVKIMRVTGANDEGLGTDDLTHVAYACANSTGAVSSWIDAGPETGWVRWELYLDANKKWFDVWKNGHYHLGSYSGAGGTVELRPATDWRFRAPGLNGYQWDAPWLPPSVGIWPFLFGYDDSHDLSSGQEIDVSEIYYDNTLARVEISDKATWDDSPASTAQREVQIPTAWSNGSITVTANLGAFACGQQAYLYVVDADGNVNANGLPVTLCDGDALAPAAPTNLTVQ